MAARVVPALILAGLAVVQAVAANSPQFQDASRRSVVVLSDLHMGIGRDPSGGWNPFEDFRWQAEFAAFLEKVNQDGKSAVDLVLNGDTFELLQSSGASCAAEAAGLGCTEAEALVRLERVLNAHDADLKALARFARTGSNRVVFVPGDHDAALLFPGVSRRVVSALAAPAASVEVARSGYWVSADGQVFAEHGHQIGFSAHKFDHWPSPVVRSAGGEQLARPWGEALVQPLYNRHENRYPIVDNVAAAGTGLRYALAADAGDVGDLVGPLLRYLLFTISWQQFRMELDDGEVLPPAWDVAQVRAQGPSFLISALPDDDRFKPLAVKALADGRLAKSMAELTDDEIVTLCDYRAAVRRSRRRFEAPLTQLSPRGPVIAECPRTPDTRGAIFDYFWRSRDLMSMRHLEATARQLPGPTRPIVVFVHGHTHLPDRAQTGANMISGGLLKIPMEGFSPLRSALTPVLINGGAWQRTITPVQLDRIKTERNLSDDELLRSLQPEQLAPCYSFVHIAPYADTPAPAVRYWRQAASGDWTLAAGCGR